MRTYAITGGIGMGKSAAAEWLKDHGIPVIDSDDLARDVVRLGKPGLRKLVDHFGEGILCPDGTLDRPSVAKIVFQNTAARRFLEQTLHPLIRERWLQWKQQCEKNGEAVCVVIIPLLFETGMESDFDAVICLTTAPEIQRQRLLKRGMSEEDIHRRIMNQWPIEEKMRRSQFVVDNNGTLVELAAQLEKIFLRQD
ncbi:MAG: dephospho-CoA kinase [Verrucomicrobia bacterium]|nr:dephospho-CoA kinase [Verrucomicrobiota bacterium]